MILCIADVLTADRVAELRDLYRRGIFEAGSATAGWHARLVKNNMQMQGSIESVAARAAMRDAIAANEVFASACLPARFGPMLFSRHEAGMEYGTHVDDALMSVGDERIRSDISLTLFLSPPDDYEGGELVIESTAGEQSYKLAVGSLIAYPSTTLHRVAPVARGERLAAVSWVQSHVRNPERREILFDLDTVRRAIFKSSGKNREFDLVTKSYTNLLRLWAIS